MDLIFFRIYFLLAILGMAMSFSSASSIQKISFPLAEDVDRADVYFVETVLSPQAVLVLCPGCNGNGEGLIKSQIWQKFAKENHLGLMGLSFSSPMKFQNSESCRGYYHASKGSGQILLDAVHKVYGKDLPLLLYGFSGGAHFTSRFEEWRSERVRAFCAYSAGWWDEPRRTDCNPPGIVACGDEDPRYGASIMYFEQGRALGKPWLWVSIPKVGHSTIPALDEFVRSYFESVLRTDPKTGIWVDIDNKRITDDEEAQRIRALSAWIPSKNLYPRWISIHEP